MGIRERYMNIKLDNTDERDGIYEMVNWAYFDLVFILLPHMNGGQ